MCMCFVRLQNEINFSIIYGYIFSYLIAIIKSTFNIFFRLSLHVCCGSASSQRFLYWLIHLNVMTGHSSLFTCLYWIIMSLRGLVIKCKSTKVPELVSSRSDGAMAPGRRSRRHRNKKSWQGVLFENQSSWTES